ncbi:MAG: BREX-1 system adenine-specific DNA-methyltransferase PglX, partial [Desulfobacteraceae bacterium]|nr:BREX-1 system adenine-specific DNA-methyltransferase PglX [Desulfobacteraceae bacterium]
FVERGLEFLRSCGRIGAITSRTCFFLSSFQKWREAVVLGTGKPEVMADLGYGVMDDAMVEAAAYVLIKNFDKTTTKTTFIRLLTDKEKADNLLALCYAFRKRKPNDDHIFQVFPDSFLDVPGAPFAYWVSDAVREVFQKFPAFESETRTAQHGGSSKDDFRFLRTYWENSIGINQWTLFAKGGAFSPYYSDIYLSINWKNDACELEAAILKKYPYLGDSANWVLHRECKYFSPGLTWPRRTNGLSFRVLPQNCIFADKGPAVFVEGNSPNTLLALLALINSKAFGLLVSVQLARTELAQSFEVGIIQKTPIPSLLSDQEEKLARLARRAWSLQRSLDTHEEISHAFILPEILLARRSNFGLTQIEFELSEIQKEIDEIAFNLYGFSKKDCLVALQWQKAEVNEKGGEDGRKNDPSAPINRNQTAHVLSWALGVVFGRFDILLATGERSIPEEPEPFDPLPLISPGMLPKNRNPFIRHCGILPEDLDHPNNLSRMLEKVLFHIKLEFSTNISHWLQRDCFDWHLKRYSKSRRQAPIYWPLQTPSGSYTLWVYYHCLTDQILYICVNDFVEPKLKTVTDDLTALRNQTTRSSAEEKELARLSDLESELKDFRDELLRIAGFWKPDLNDGVQITAAPLWKLFQHRQWQKKLKDTWEKMESGEYDWAHLACSIWPERVLRKCHTDRSLAIAHDVENDFWEEIEVPVIRRGKDTGKTKLEWQPKPLTEDRLQELIHQKMAAMRSSH